MGDQQWLRKQLAVHAVVRGMKGEMANVNGFLKQRGCWKVMWQKGKERYRERGLGDQQEYLLSLRL